MREDNARAPLWTHKNTRTGARVGVQQYGLTGRLWRLVETVTPDGLYIHGLDAYGSREGAEHALAASLKRRGWEVQA